MKYIVQELGSEYNDEIYSLSDSGIPLKIFKSRKKAQDYCDELTIQKLKSENIMEYGYNTSEIFKNIYEFVLAYNEIFDKKINNDNFYKREFSFPAKMTVEQYNEIKEFLKIKFYEVVECEEE